MIEVFFEVNQHSVQVLSDAGFFFDGSGKEAKEYKKHMQDFAVNADPSTKEVLRSIANAQCNLTVYMKKIFGDEKSAMKNARRDFCNFYRFCLDHSQDRDFPVFSGKHLTYLADLFYYYSEYGVN